MAVGPVPAEDTTELDDEARPAMRERRYASALLGAGPLAEAERLAARPLQPEGVPQGYIETVASDGSGTVWVVGWMRPWGIRWSFPRRWPEAGSMRSQSR